MPELDAEQSEGENGWGGGTYEDEEGADAEGEKWGVSAVSQVMDDEAKVRTKRVRSAAGARALSKVWGMGSV